MAGTNKLAPLKQELTRIVRREDGSAIVELAIIFPFLLVLFVGTAELGRLFYTYTTLAKATNVGARYLSTSRDVTKGNATAIANAKAAARNLVVCGDANGCANKTPVVSGLTTAKVNICDNFSTPCVPALPGAPIKYFRVEIQNYTYSAGLFNLAGKIGEANSTFYFALTPGTEMRYMP